MFNSISGKDRSEAVRKRIEAEPLISSLLGLEWKVEADKFAIGSEADNEVPVRNTQTAVRSVLAAVFDLLLFTRRMRKMLKTICAKTGKQWD